MRILTERLELIAADPRLARALASDQAEMGRLLGVRVPQEWPPELMVHALEFLAQATERDPDAVGWWVWLIVLPTDRVLIGSIGFKGPPDADGRVDIGYSVLDAWQRRGYASEAAAALVDWAFADPRVSHIIGETFSHLSASIRVLGKSGFGYVGVGVGHEGEPEVLQFERRRG